MLYYVNAGVLFPIFIWPIFICSDLPNCYFFNFIGKTQLTKLCISNLLFLLYCTEDSYSTIHNFVIFEKSFFFFNQGNLGRREIKM